ncbi:hypothetical protein [Tepidibacter formicigenes]|uniref:hypothetical protein n=1 Tax=Tepidibacter formicigenes TaxID=227138 RepID=UPI0009351679|nr:hypothetical protein [Tepidibacter formicigenes]
MYNYYYYMNYCYRAAQKLYPKIYHEVYPYVVVKCEKEDTEYNMEMNPFPREEKIEKMVDEIYEDYTKNCKHRSDEEEYEDDEQYRQRRYRRRRFTRDLIRILLIEELLGRRGFRRRRRKRFDDYNYYPYY